MREVSFAAATDPPMRVPVSSGLLRAAGPGDDDDDDETPIGDPPDDDGDDDWDDEDDDDEEPLQAKSILRRSIAMSEPSRHNGTPLTTR